MILFYGGTLIMAKQQLTVEERLQKNIQKLEERKQNNIKRYQKTELKKYIGWLGIVVAQCLIAMVIILVTIFSVWNHFNPTQDYLYFIVIYTIFGNILNICVFAYAESCIKKHKARKACEMKLRQRQITNYFDYQIRDEYERAGFEWSDWTEEM